MKTFVKSNNTLHNGNQSILKVFSAAPTLSDLKEGEVCIVENDTFYQKVGNNINSLGSAAAPPSGSVGDIIAYYGTTNPDPDNFVICDGRTFSQTDFPALYSLLGTNTTPNLVGYHLKGVGNNSAWSSHDAISLNSKVAANYPNHTHSVSGGSHTHSINQGSHYHSVTTQCNAYTFYYASYYYNGSSSCYLCYKMAKDYWYTSSNYISSFAICSASLGTVTIGCPSTASGYNAVRYGSETKCKDKTVLFLMRAK